MSPENELPSFISRRVLGGHYYFLSLEPSLENEVVVACGGSERCGPDYELEREGFRYLGIEYVVAGQARLELDGRTFELRPGCVFAYRPNTKLRISARPGTPLFKRFVDLSGLRAMELFDRSPLAKMGVCDLAGASWVDELFRQLSTFGEAGDDRARRTCALLAEALLLQIGPAAATSGELGSPALDTYRRCRAFIEKEYLRLASAAEVARRCNVDQAYLSRLFQRYDQESPYRKIVRLRMGFAARRLLDSGGSVKEVAAEVGYDDPLHFSRVFKRVYGIAPSQFRPRE